MERHVRIASTIGGLVLASAITGAVGGIAAIEAAVLVYLHQFAPFELAGLASVIGAGFGAVVAPALTWSVLRTVPIGRAIASSAIGSGLGGAIGILVGAGAVNPYVPLAWNLPPVPQGLIGALAGATLAALCLRVLSRQSRITEREG